MKFTKYFFLLIFSAIYSLSNAQDIGSTFRVGLNFPQFIGDSEQSSSGMDLEEFSRGVGFHVAGGINFKLLDNYGFKAELVFTQKGSRYRYDNGPSTYIFYATTSGTPVFAQGRQTINNRITNSYLEIPVTGYGKLGKLEYSLGAHVAVLVSSTGTGDFQFNGESGINNQPIEISSEIIHNYRKDNLESAAEIASFDEIFFKTLDLDGETAFLLTEETAYAQYTQLDGKAYRTLDFGLHAGLSYYISPGLFFGVTVQYGLRDITNPFYERSLSESRGLEVIKRSDDDRNFNIQASIGFSL